MRTTIFPSFCIWSRAPIRESKKSPPRISMTAAIRAVFFPESLSRVKKVVSNAGGKLSIQ
ncbi:hypothetical protein D3C79_956030 [compost metagenome]